MRSFVVLALIIGLVMWSESESYESGTDEEAEAAYQAESLEHRAQEEDAAALAAPMPEEPEQGTEASPECDPNYEGACLDPNSSDYDCEGGTGDGPDYTGTVSVIGDDPYDLDRDGDGVACDA